MTRTVLITGGNRGIGLETVKGFAKRGYKVLMGCRRLQDGLDTVKDLTQQNVHAVSLPLNDESSIAESIQNIVSEHGDIDILVNNAGILCDKTPEELTSKEMLNSFQIQVNGPFSLIQKVLPAMKASNFGRIINLSSGWGSFYEGLEGPLAYSTTKAALNALTVGIARTLEEHPNVTINSVCPGWVRTRMGGEHAPKSPEEGADTIIWLGTTEDECPNGLFFRERTQIYW